MPHSAMELNLNQLKKSQFWDRKGNHHYIGQHYPSCLINMQVPLNYAPYVEYLLSFGVQHIRTRQVREQRRLRPRLPNAASRNLTTIMKEKRALGAQACECRSP